MGDYEAELLGRIEVWFRERAITLEYGEVGDDGISEWVALMVPDSHKAGLVEGGGGVTKLAAAQDAKERYVARHGDALLYSGDGTGVTETPIPGGAVAGGIPPTVVVQVPSIEHERGMGQPTVTLGVPPEVRERLEKTAMEHGWYIGWADEPDGSIRWFVFDRDGDMLLKTGVASAWDDAKLAMIEDLYPPSDEGRV